MLYHLFNYNTANFIESYNTTDYKKAFDHLVDEIGLLLHIDMSIEVCDFNQRHELKKELIVLLKGGIVAKKLCEIINRGYYDTRDIKELFVITYDEIEIDDIHVERLAEQFREEI